MKPKVSICMVTYNHEKYIRQAIESVLMQKADFQYELVIGEDCSTDKTKEIIIEYQHKHPNKIRIHFNKTNMGAGSNFVQTLKACKGDYIALLDGDDYWTDPHKLQKQVDYLDNNRDYTISSHNVYVAQDGNKKNPIEWLGNEHRETSTLEDILEFGSGGATCSLVFRRKSIFPLPHWYHSLPGGDWALQILCTTYGKMYYFRVIMGSYRTDHPNNALAVATMNAREGGSDTIGLPYKNTLRIISILDKYFNYRYSNLLINQRMYCYYNLAIAYKQHSDLSKSKYYALRCIKEILGWHPYLTIERLVNLAKIVINLNTQ